MLDGASSPVIENDSETLPFAVVRSINLTGEMGGSNWEGEF